MVNIYSYFKDEQYKCFKTSQPINKLYIALVSIARVQAISLMKYLRVCSKSQCRQSHSWGDDAAVSALGQFQLREWSALRLLNGLPSLLYSLLIAALLFISSALALSPVTEVCAVWELERSELRRTWSRSCFDDVPEVFGVRITVLFPSDYRPDKYVGLDWPTASDAPRVPPPGSACIAMACHHCQHSAGRASSN